MGNWRTVNLRGTLAKNEVDDVRRFITVASDWSNFHCLSASPGLAGLGMWAAEEIHANGNLAERDYSVDDVAEVLRQIVEIAPSLTLKAHCGDDYESYTCIATITVADGKVEIGAPEKPTLTEISADVMRGRLLNALFPPA